MTSPVAVYSVTGELWIWRYSIENRKYALGRIDHIRCVGAVPSLVQVVLSWIACVRPQLRCRNLVRAECGVELETFDARSFN